MKILQSLALMTGLILSLWSTERCNAQVTVAESYIFVESVSAGYDIDIYHDWATNDIFVEYLRDDGWPNGRTRIYRERIPWRPNFHWIVVVGNNNNDTIQVRSDIFTAIFGGNGDDLLSADCPVSLVYGGNGNDALSTVESNLGISYGGAGDDALVGNGAYMFGEEGNDCLIGAEKDDYMDGGPGRDFIMAGFGMNQVDAGTGWDLVWVDQNGSFDMGPVEMNEAQLAQPPQFFPIVLWRDCYTALRIVDELLEQLGLPNMVFPEGYWKQG